MFMFERLLSPMGCACSIEYSAGMLKAPGFSLTLAPENTRPVRWLGGQKHLSWKPGDWPSVLLTHGGRRES